MPNRPLAVLQFALIEAEKIFGIALLQLPLAPFVADDPLLRALECRAKREDIWWPMTAPRPLGAKLKFLWFLALPPKAYMYARYNTQNALLSLYFKRLLHAIRGTRQPYPH